MEWYHSPSLEAMPESPDLLPVVYRQLRQLAESRLSKEGPQTLSATDLVHEAYIRLVGPKNDVQWESEAHFFGAASIAMRRILIDSARKKIVRRKAGTLPKFSMEAVEFSVAMTEESAAVMLDVDECLSVFAQEYPDEAKLIEVRFFAGLTMEEAAKVLEISRRTAQRRWKFAKARMKVLLDELPSGE